METELCKLAYKYGSDKCPRIKHDFTPFYFELFSPIRDKVKKLLEIGVGYKGGNSMKHAPDYYKIGASLYMWRDFFPQAQIYGIDVEPQCIFKDERIETFYRSQSRVWDLARTLDKTGKDLDIVIDDGSHNIADQLFTCTYLMPFLRKGVIYIIEDAHESRELIKRMPYKCERIQFPRTRKAQDNRLVIVKNEEKSPSDTYVRLRTFNFNNEKNT